jgi:hypothetical protein
MHQNIYVLRTSKLKNPACDASTLRRLARGLCSTPVAVCSDEIRCYTAVAFFVPLCGSFPAKCATARPTGGSASVADCSTFGVIDPPRPMGSSLDCIFTVQKPYVIELSRLTSSEKQIPRNCCSRRSPEINESLNSRMVESGERNSHDASVCDRAEFRRKFQRQKER